VDASVSVCVDVQNTLVNNVFKMWANDDVKGRFWPRLAQDTIGCFCLSEAGSGSDAFALKTRAEKKGDYYVINGRCGSGVRRRCAALSLRPTHMDGPTASLDDSQQGVDHQRCGRGHLPDHGQRGPE
jgi:hypothetical protein